MKKSLVLGILGIAASLATSYGQGLICLCNFHESILSPQDVVYGPGSGGTVGQGVNNSFTAGMYIASGNIVGSVLPDPTGTALPTSLNPNFVLATGTDATAQVAGTDAAGLPGQYVPAGLGFYQTGLGGGVTITVMVIAYNGANYGAATVRGHSTAFTMVTSVGTAFPNLTGNYETDGGFSVFPIPEPSTFALAGLGAVALLTSRRKK